MIKKLLLALALLLPLWAQASTGGSWKVHPFYVASRVNNVVDTRNEVYYLVGGSLYSYNKATGESTSLVATGRLSDVTVTGIYYNHFKDYLVVAYDNSNIDIILADGRVLNMPELKNATVPQSKAINDVTFAGDDRAYVATAFGLVVIDDNSWAITENRFYIESLTSVVHVGNKIVLAYRGSIRAISVDANRENVYSFTKIGMERRSPKFIPIDDTHFFVNSTDSLEVVTIEGNSFTATTLSRDRATTIQRTPTGYLCCYPDQNFHITTDLDGSNPHYDADNGEMFTSSPSGDGTVWAMGSNGLHRQGDASYSKPNGIGIATTAFWAAYNPGDGKFYLASTADNALLSSANIGAKTEIWSYDGTNWTDVTPANVPLWNSGQANYQGNYWLNFLPGTTNHYVCATRAAGVMNVVDNQVAAKYYFTHNGSYNIPIKDKYKLATALDTAGNLWLVESYKKFDKMVAVLPRDKVYNPSQEVTVDDFITPNVPGTYFGSFKQSDFVVSPVSDVKVFSLGGYAKPIILWDNHGDINNLNPTCGSFSQFVGDDGGSITWDYVYCLHAASNGEIWVGTNAGVFAFDPVQALASPDTYVARHMKALDLEGVSEDYIAGGAQINCITEDEQGRKYLGTNAEGIFIVSADGSRTLATFTTENSSLPSNCIYNMAFNPTTNSLLIVTMNGVCEYFVDGQHAAAQAGVTVSPNPVRPDFTGYVTISGLQSRASITIYNVKGRAVHSAYASQDGVLLWNFNNTAGEHIPTGLYTVKQAGTPVATVLVIK